MVYMLSYCISSFFRLNQNLYLFSLLIYNLNRTQFNSHPISNTSLYINKFIFKLITLMSNNIKPPADLFDLSKLSESSLRKYLSYFRINTTDQNMKTKISEHFHHQFKVDSAQVIEKFLQLKRQEKDKRRPRNPRATN